MSVIKSNEIFSPQNYCDTFFGVCPVFSGNQNELRSLLNENGHSNLRDFPFEAIESIVKNKIPVIRFYEHYDKVEASVPISISEITEETPYGMYVFED